MNRVAALPMYNVTPALAAEWRAFLADVLKAVDPHAALIDPGEDLHALWRRPDLLISQTCGYPLVSGLQRHVQLIATPQFDAPGCAGANYSSALITRANAPFDSLDQQRIGRELKNKRDRVFGSYKIIYTGKDRRTKNATYMLNEQGRELYRTPPNTRKSTL